MRGSTVQRVLGLCLALVAMLPAGALAQSKVVKDKEQVTFNEIERGFFLGTAAGAYVMFNAPGTTVRPLTYGPTTRIDIGGDIGERVVANVFLQASSFRASSAYTGTAGSVAGTGLAKSGDFYLLSPGASVRVNLVGFEDSQEVKRLWLFVRAAGGAAFMFPQSLLPDIQLMVQASPGIEYFTRLRHFSLGLEATFAVLIPLAGPSGPTFGLTVTPTLRYSF